RASLLNWGTDISGGPISVLGQAITLSGDVFNVHGALDSIDVAGLLHGHATFDFTKGTIAIDGANGANATLVTLALSGLHVRIGQDDGVRFVVDGGSLALAAITAGTPTVGTDTRRWIALKGSLSNLSFEGVNGLTFSLADLRLEINRADGTYDDGSSAPTDPAALDWQHDLDLNGDTTFGGVDDQLVVGTGSIPIDFHSGLPRAPR